jgi:hypothetical protein
MWNKYNSEWGHEPVNFWPERSVTATLRAAACVGPAIFWRWPNDASLGTGESLEEARPFEDNAAARASGHAMLLADVLDASDVDLVNVAQLVLLATAEVAIGVQGGVATLGSAVGARMLLLCKRGAECARTRNASHVGDFAWHPGIAQGSLATVSEPDDAVRCLSWLCRAPAYFHAGSGRG